MIKSTMLFNMCPFPCQNPTSNAQCKYCPFAIHDSPSVDYRLQLRSISPSRSPSRARSRLFLYRTLYFKLPAFCLISSLVFFLFEYIRVYTLCHGAGLPPRTIILSILPTLLLKILLLNGACSELSASTSVIGVFVDRRPHAPVLHYILVTTVI
jgi:hypothetical protein